MDHQERQAIVDGEHVRMLSIGYMVSAGIHVLFSVFGLFYALMGVFFTAVASQMPPDAQQPPPRFIGMMFAFICLAGFGMLIAIATLHFLVARRLQVRRSRTLCMVVAALTCFEIPYGTALGVFTFVVLSRPSVAAAFSSESAQPPKL